MLDARICYVRLVENVTFKNLSCPYCGQYVVFIMLSDFTFNGGVMLSRILGLFRDIFPKVMSSDFLLLGCFDCVRPKQNKDLLVMEVVMLHVPFKLLPFWTRNSVAIYLRFIDGCMLFCVLIREDGIQTWDI